MEHKKAFSHKTHLVAGEVWDTFIHLCLEVLIGAHQTDSLELCTKLPHFPGITFPSPNKLSYRFRELHCRERLESTFFIWKTELMQSQATRFDNFQRWSWFTIKQVPKAHFAIFPDLFLSPEFLKFVFTIL